MSTFKTGKAVKDVVYSIAGKDNRDLITVAFGWKNIVGNLLAERAKITKLENGVLFVAVTNNVWLQELVLRRSQFLEDIERILHVKLSNMVFYLSRSKN
ncbi:MAG: DUF721 domain-containing protein [Candidatus Cloacimonetes bacterium]|nr:DUF721 domain-containing protein [Candidatus Cloacimonadota bacterium]